MKLLLSVFLLFAAMLQAPAQTNLATAPALKGYKGDLVFRGDALVFLREEPAPRDIMQRDAYYSVVDRRITRNVDGKYTWFGTNDVVKPGVLVVKREYRRGDQWIEFPK